MSQECLQMYVFIKHNTEQELFSITNGLAKGLTSSLRTLHGLFMCRARHTKPQKVPSTFLWENTYSWRMALFLVTLYTPFCICACHPGWVNGPHWISGKIPWFLLLLLWRGLFSVSMDCCTSIKHNPVLWRQEKGCFFYLTVCSHKHVQWGWLFTIMTSFTQQGAAGL